VRKTEPKIFSKAHPKIARKFKEPGCGAVMENLNGITEL